MSKLPCRLTRRQFQIQAVFNFIGSSFSNGDNVRTPIQFKREGQPQHLKR